MRLKTWLQRHALTAFVVLAYLLPWSGILALLAARGFDLSRIGASDGVVMFFMLILGPSLSSVFLHGWLAGRPGLRDLWRRWARWRVGGAWYAAALLSVPILVVAILLGLARWVSPAFTPNFQVAGLFIGLLAGGLEEIGWTGFATPRLLNGRGPLSAGLLLGVAWAGWHALADFSSNISTMGALWPAWFVLFWIVPLTAYRMLMTWVYAHTGSLLLAQLMHASYTGWLLTLSPALPTAAGLIWQTSFGLGLWVLVLGVAYGQRRRAAAPMGRAAAASGHPSAGDLR